MLDLIPCINSDGEYGVYDLVSGQFFGNSGTGTLIGGNPGSYHGGSGDSFYAPLKVTGADTENVNDISGVFGGGNTGTVNGNVSITVSGGKLYGYIYGGGFDTSSAVAGNTTVSVSNGEVNDTNILRVYGGGQYATSEVAGSSHVTLGTASGKAEEEATVTGFIRGSGALSGVGVKSVLDICDGAVLPAGCDVAGGGYTGTALRSELNIRGGTVKCDAYAGSAGEYTYDSSYKIDGINTEKGKVGSSALTVSGGTVTGNLYAGGNKGYVGDPDSSDMTGSVVSAVTVSGGTVTGNIYGGCMVATTYGSSTVDLTGGTVSGKIFGGGLGKNEGDTGKTVEGEIKISTDLPSDVKGITTATVTGGTLTGSLYGGADCRGSVTKSVINANATPGGSVFGGGYGVNTVVTDTEVRLNASGSTATTVYGGGELGTVTNASVKITQWTGDIFGGGKGEISGSTLTDAVTETTSVTLQESDTFAI